MRPRGVSSRQALILDPSNPVGMCLFVENELIWKRGLLEDREAAATMEWLSYLTEKKTTGAWLHRAEAVHSLALGNYDRCIELAKAAQQEAGDDALAMLIEADCTTQKDPGAAESLVFRANQRRGLPRGSRVLARALAGNGPVPQSGVRAHQTAQERSQERNGLDGPRRAVAPRW